MSWIAGDHREVGYWIGREWWGRGVATGALRLLLDEVTDRPILAHVVLDNIGSQRVLEHCGFARVGEAAADDGVHEAIYRLGYVQRLAGASGPPPVSFRLVTDQPTTRPPTLRSTRPPTLRSTRPPTPDRPEGRPDAAPSPTADDRSGPVQGRRPRGGARPGPRLLPVPGRRPRRLHRPDAAQRRLELAAGRQRGPALRGDPAAAGHRPDDHLPAPPGRADRRGRRRPLASGTRTVGRARGRRRGAVRGRRRPVARGRSIGRHGPDLTGRRLDARRTEGPVRQ